MALPHIQNSVAGRNLYDPYHNCLFEVYFTLPEAIRDQFAQDEAVITEHVLKITGLEALDKGPEANVVQKYQGTSRTYVAPKLDDTTASFSVELSLNLRNGTDNYIYKIFKSWKNLNYDLATGSIVLKKDYVASWLKLTIANRAGDVIRQIVFKDVMLDGGLDGINEWDYGNNEAVNLTVKFKSDWWTDDVV